jgi:hypothetical protein
MDIESIKTIVLFSLPISIISMMLFVFILYIFMKSKFNKGNMSGEQLIEFTAGLVMNRLRKENKSFKLKIDSLKTIDDEIDEMLKNDKPADILASTDTVFMLGCYLGTVIKHCMGGKWMKDDGKYPRFMKLKGGEIILPFERIAKRILAGKEDSIFDYVLILKNQ